MMTSPKQLQVTGYRINACRSIRLQMVKTLLQSVIAIPRSEAVTAGRKAHNVLLPRDSARKRQITNSRNGVDRRARVDPWGDPGAHTAGPTCPAQSGTRRKAPAPLPVQPRAVAKVGQGRGPGAWRAVDVSRPGAPVMRRAVSSATARTSDRRDPPPPPDFAPKTLIRGGVHLPTNAPIERCQMPHILRFHDNDEGPSTLPDPSAVGHAAAWAAERGYWDVATCLMELAHALADQEAPAPAKTMLEREADALTEIRLNSEADALAARIIENHMPAPLGAHQCEHGFWTAHNRHVATSGVCDLSAGTGV